MKKSLILLGLLGLQQAFAQTGKVGINTDNPSATLNVKSKTGTTSSTKNLELENASGTKLVTVLDNGNVGVGTTSPSTKLEVNNGTTNGAIKIVDGTQGAGKVLTSDANGVGTWKTLFSPNINKGTFSWAAETAIGNTNWNSIASLVVPPGTHTIYTKLHIIYGHNFLTNQEGALRTYIGTVSLNNNDNQNNINPIDGSVGFIVFTGVDFQYTNSFIYINNTTGNQTLYFNIQSDNMNIKRSKFAQTNPAAYKGVNWVENYFYSVPLFTY